MFFRLPGSFLSSILVQGSQNPRPENPRGIELGVDFTSCALQVAFNKLDSDADGEAFDDRREFRNIRVYFKLSWASVPVVSRPLCFSGPGSP